LLVCVSMQKVHVLNVQNPYQLRDRLGLNHSNCLIARTYILLLLFFSFWFVNFLCHFGRFGRHAIVVVPMGNLFKCLDLVLSG